MGSTGFVGGNLSETHTFTASCHSSDVKDFYGFEPDVCVYAGIPSAMYLANTRPDEDLAIIKQALSNIRNIKPKKLILISTVAVYDMPRTVDENTVPNSASLPAYGRNRFLLEECVRRDYTEAVIVRLPALYGRGLKKNFLYDIHTIIPQMLKADKYNELSERNPLIQNSYTYKDNDFYKLSDKADREGLRQFFEKNDFNALSFTDSRSKYQFYNLARLWDDISILIENDIKVMNLVTPPVSVSDIYQRITVGKKWENYLESYYDYDIRSTHAAVFGGKDGYICNAEDEIEDIIRFMNSWKEKIV